MSLRAALVLVLIAGCPKPPDKPKPAADIVATAVRIKIAYAEARRYGGIVELVDLSKHGSKPERALALRGLGRIGGELARVALYEALGDPDVDVSAAAAAGIGLAVSLDENTWSTPPLLAALAAHEHPAIVEAIGRAADATAQPVLIAKLSASVEVAEQAAIALGRHGRRKIALSNEAREALGKATTHADVRVRYAATWALAREFATKQDDPQYVAVTPLLVARIADQDPEVRAQAVAALARRKQVAAGAKEIEQALIDSDWRVVVEAIRALGKDHRAPIEAAVVRAKNLLVSLEAARTFDDGLALVVGANEPRYRQLVVELTATRVKNKQGTVAERREAIAKMLADHDVRVRAAAIGVLPSQWTDGDDTDRDATVKMIVSSIASKDPLLSGSAIDAADELLETLKDKITPTRDALSAALVTRADGEKDVELAAGLFGVITKHAIGQGLTACTKGLTGHPVLIKAAIECVKKLGGVAPDPKDPPEAKPPFADITAVIGKRVVWHVKTNKGDFDVELLPDVAPWAVATIVTLTKRGFYDGLDFHRVVPDFVVQGGDPTESGWGGPGFMIPAEPASMLDGPGFVAGGVGIADAGRDSGGSQWFVMHSRATHLDGRYTWIGRVKSTAKPADALQIGDEVTKASVEIFDR